MDCISRRESNAVLFFNGITGATMVLIAESRKIRRDK
jgi:hypothetical protein